MHKKKIQNSWFNMSRILVLVGAIAAALLSMTNTMTEGPRAATERKNKLIAIEKILPGFNNVPADEMKRYLVNPDETITPIAQGEKVNEKLKTRVVELYPAKKDGQLLGYAVTSFTEQGYSGKFFIMVGISVAGKITDISIIDNKETPGLGTEMAKPKFKDQFKGKSPESFKMLVKKDGGDVDQITAATISSRAFCDAVVRAFNTINAKGVS